MSSAPPNWYPDPHNPNQMRWWTGEQWTDDTVSLVAEPEVQATEPVASEPEAEPEPQEERASGFADRIASRFLGAGTATALAEKHDATVELADIQERLESARRELSDAQLFIEVGYREFEHPAESSVVWKERLVGIRARAKELQKGGGAVSSISLSFGASDKQGAVFARDLRNLALSLYNSESEAIIKATKSDPDPGIKRLKAVASRIERFGKMINLAVSPAYQANREDEIRTVSLHRKTVEYEKEQERAHKETLREQARVEEELKRQKAKLEKEAQHRRNVVEKLAAEQAKRDAEMKAALAELDARYRAAAEEERAAIVAEGEELRKQVEARETELAEARSKLGETEDEMTQVDFRAANTRAGYVYVISNIGAFGDGVVKIGMTRRLEPIDRVRELGGASVPFRFDTHALIFSDDAVALENMLHKAFDARRLNLVNQRREFFRATPREVLDILTLQKVNVVEFTEAAAAVEYRSSEQQRVTAA